MKRGADTVTPVRHSPLRRIVALGLGGDLGDTHEKPHFTDFSSPAGDPGAGGLRGDGRNPATLPTANPFAGTYHGVTELGDDRDGALSLTASSTGVIAVSAATCA